MLYKKNNQDELDTKLFKNPTSEYRGFPFWAWNCVLKKETLLKQIEYLKQMGFGGFHMHPRVGLDTEYLSDEFMDCIKACVEKAEKEEMLAWLYDEDRYPSGSAGGIISKHPEYSAVRMLFTPKLREAEKTVTHGKTYLIASYNIVFNNESELVSYTRCQESDANWYAYCTVVEKGGMYNGHPYVDVLNKKAIEEFVDLTYRKYKKAVGDKYGSVVPAIFTDEAFISIPAWYFYTHPFDGDHRTDICAHWTHDLPEVFKELYDKELLDYLPEVVWTLEGNKASEIKYRFFDMVAERFASSFADTCGKRCKEDGIMLTGHMNRENMLREQTATTMETMRSFRAFGLPGIDMLYNGVELNTAKEAQSAAHQYGREGVLTELYGISNWDFDFRGYKYQGDWQAALGATVRVPHLSLMSLYGEAKRDYPASINYQSPWYKDFSYVEDHFARLNTALTRGNPVVNVAVIHPIETYWINIGVSDSSISGRERIESIFKNVTEWLLYGLIDFDFIAESLLPELWDIETQSFGAMKYDAIIVPGLQTIRKTTLDALYEFKQRGGKVVFISDAPQYVDAVKSSELKKLYEQSTVVEMCKESLLEVLEEERIVDIRTGERALIKNGYRTECYLYNLREDTNCKWLYIASTKKMACADVDTAQKLTIKIKGEYTPKYYDTVKGEIHDIDYEIRDRDTYVEMNLYSLDSVLLRLNLKTANFRKTDKVENKVIKTIDFKNKVDYEICEPNVLLLDCAKYVLDGGKLCAEENILKINNICRKKIGWDECSMVIVQPWTIKDRSEKHMLTLKFNIKSDIEVKGTLLALEQSEQSEIILNGENVANKRLGYYIDEAIDTVKLPMMKKGSNALVIKTPLTRVINAEYCYLLGDFNVRVEGCERTITAPTKKIGFSPITSQGLPYYGGSLTYSMKVETENCIMSIACSSYCGAAVKVYLDGEYRGIIAYAPYRVMLENVKAGKHTVELELLGNRFNTLGALHKMDTTVPWCTPYAWRSEGNDWCYEYKLRDTGILKSPIIEIFSAK